MKKDKELKAYRKFITPLIKLYFATQREIRKQQMGIGRARMRPRSLRKHPFRHPNPLARINYQFKVEHGLAN